MRPDPSARSHAPSKRPPRWLWLLMVVWVALAAAALWQAAGKWQDVCSTAQRKT